MKNEINKLLIDSININNINKMKLSKLNFINDLLDGKLSEEEKTKRINKIFLEEEKIKGKK